MNKQIIKSVLTLLLTGLALIYWGCAEDENPVTPSSPIAINILMGPSGDVPANAYVTYKWQASGGSGNYTTYTYQLSDIDASAQTTTETSKTYFNLAQGAHTFTVTVTDDAGNSATSSKAMNVVADAGVPQIEITQGPLASGDVAVNSSVALSWAASDPNSYFGLVVNYDYELRRDDTVLVASATNALATTATFDSLQAGHHVFKVTVHDNAALSNSAELEFEVVPAYILWLDNHGQGSVYNEFIEKQEWVAALNGVAWEEFDIIDNYTSTSAALAAVLEGVVNPAGTPVNTIIWDDEGGGTPMLWYSTNGIGARTPWLWNFVDRGGNMILLGSNVMDWIYNTNPPVAGEFECEYMGLIPDSLIETITLDTTYKWVKDTLVTWHNVGTDSQYSDTTIKDVYARFIVADTSITDAWANDDYVTLTGDNGFSNITIDVGKDAGTLQGSYIFNILDLESTGMDIKPIMLDDDTGLVTSYIVNTGKGGKIAVLGMNLYFSPTAEIRAVIQKILTEEFEL